MAFFYRTALLAPIRWVYRTSYWRGMPDADICAGLTAHKAEFWGAHPDECNARIQHDVEAVAGYIVGTAYAGVLLYTLVVTLRALPGALHRAVASAYKLYRRRNSPCRPGAPSSTFRRSRAVRSDHSRNHKRRL